MKNVTIFFLLTVILISCNNSRDIKPLSTQQLLNIRTNKEKTISNDSIENLIHFSINNKTDNYLFFLVDSIDYNKKIVTQKCKMQERTLLLEKKYRKNSFDICIRNKDTIFIDGMFSYSHSYSFLFYNNHIKRDSFHSIIVCFDTVKDWSSINISHTKVYVGMDLNKKDEFNNIELKLFFNSVDTIMDVYSKVRDTISYKRFKNGFNDLKFNEKVSIIREKPLLVILDFNQCECYGYFSPSARRSMVK